jgi:hypothetical protein
VIALLVILAALIFPVVVEAREKARSLTCLSNARQIGHALTLYAGDYEETLCPWFVRSGLPRDGARRDLLTWAHLVQPYLRNDDPPRVEKPSGVDPVGVMRCPSFNEERFLATANRPDCDDGELTYWFPPRQYFAHYGIGFGSAARADPSESCTRDYPYYHYAGNDVRYPPLQMMGSIMRPAETVIVTDGYTGITVQGAVGTTMGCEAAESHQGGGSHVFVDGHAQWIARNSERYLAQDPGGCWYKKYYTIDR